MGGKRLSRRHESCPSNKRQPDVVKHTNNRQRILENSDLHPDNFANCELLHNLNEEKNKMSTVDLHRRTQKISRLSTLTYRPNSTMKSSSIKPDFSGSLPPVGENSEHISGMDMYHNGSLTDDQAEELNMDHIYVSFADFLWAHTFIGPCSFYLWKKNTTWLRIRSFLVSKGLLKKKPVDLELLVGKLCLEQSQVIHYYGRTKTTPEIAGFFFADFPYIDQTGKYVVADLFAVDIDLSTKKMVKAKLDDRKLNPSQTLILLWFNTIAAQHVKLHALANWGINSDPSLKDSNPFFHRNSIVTTMYNYFGYSCFHTYMEEWERQGLLSKGWDPQVLQQCFNHGISANIWQHPNIDELMKHSEFVNFIVKIRNVFIGEFAKQKHLFPGVNGEAMFVGTILHSLDHTLMDWNLEDPLWLDVDDPEFHHMAELGRVVKMGFVQDVPGLYFHKRYKGSGHPFYDTIYEKAAKLNKKLADNMDTCIIK